MEQWKTKFKELGDRWFEGELTVPKTELWLVLISCFLMGMLYGLKKAPMTHGVMICGNNGNNNGNGSSAGRCMGHKGSAKAKDAEEEGQNCGGEAGAGSGRQHGRHKCRKNGRCCSKRRCR